MHKGHRSRLVGRVADGGALYPHELLEALLFPACPRRDMNPTAHLLIERFKNLDGVFSASVEELEQVGGVGRNLAEYIACLGKCLPRFNGGKCFAVVQTTEQFIRFEKMRAAGDSDEIDICILDEEGRVRRMFTFAAEGGEAIPRRIVKGIAVSKAYGVYAAYKYATTRKDSTERDDAFVRAVAEACDMTGAKLYDCCIIKPDGKVFSYFVSDRLEAVAARGRREI